MGAIEEPPVMRRHRISTEDYHRMGAAGVFAPDARVELIDGEVIDIAPRGTRHWAAVTRIDHLLRPCIGDRALVAVQTSIRLGRHSEPQPDIALVKPRDDFYSKALPTAADTLLVIEVADTTARYDREIKLSLYARHGIGELWIVDLEANLLRLYSAPSGEGYSQSREIAQPGITAIAALPGATIDLGRLFDA
ncbi:MAG: Uma2 family endonuclease [Rubrivivax sp.]